jgi:hypothetical protein
MPEQVDGAFGFGDLERGSALLEEQCAVGLEAAGLLVVALVPLPVQELSNDRRTALTAVGVQVMLRTVAGQPHDEPRNNRILRARRLCLHIGPDSRSAGLGFDRLLLPYTSTGEVRAS